MKKNCIAGLFLFTFLPFIQCQITTPNESLNFKDSLSISPLHDWISIENPETNSWETGTPSKDYFNGAYTGNRAILTDSVHFYANNLNDCFYITIPWIDYIWGEGILSFYHKFDTDTLTDGGVIEILDGDGSTWINVLDDDNLIYKIFIGIYEGTLQGGEMGFSGKSDGWQYVELYWFWNALTKNGSGNYSDTKILRFRFVSDNNDNQKEGWMIDDIVFRGYDIGGDIGYNRYGKTAAYPNPATGVVCFNNPEPDAITTIQIFNMTGQLMQEMILTDNRIDISGYRKGVYLYKLFREERQITTGKIIKL